MLQLLSTLNLFASVNLSTPLNAITLLLSSFTFRHLLWHTSTKHPIVTLIFFSDSPQCASRYLHTKGLVISIFSILSYSPHNPFHFVHYVTHLCLISLSTLSCSWLLHQSKPSLRYSSTATSITSSCVYRGPLL